MVCSATDVGSKCNSTIFFYPYSVNAFHEVCIDACATPCKGSHFSCKSKTIMLRQYVYITRIAENPCLVAPPPISYISAVNSPLYPPLSPSLPVSSHSAHHTSIITSRPSMATVPSSNTLLLTILALDNAMDLHWTELIEATQALGPPHNALHLSRPSIEHWYCSWQSLHCTALTPLLRCLHVGVSVATLNKPCGPHFDHPETRIFTLLSYIAGNTVHLQPSLISNLNDSTL